MLSSDAPGLTSIARETIRRSEKEPALLNLIDVSHAYMERTCLVLRLKNKIINCWPYDCNETTVNLIVFVFFNSKNWLSRTPGLETDGFDFTGKLKKGVSAWLKDLEDKANVISPFLIATSFLLNFHNFYFHPHAQSCASFPHNSITVWFSSLM